MRKNLGLTFCTWVHGRRDRYHGNALSATVKMYVTHIFTSRTTSVPSLTEIHESIVRQSQCRKKPRVNILYTGAWRKGPLPWQRTFRHCQRVCHSHLHLKANMCAKSQWNPHKHRETITRNVRKKPRDTIWAHGQTHERSPFHSPLWNVVWRGTTTHWSLLKHAY